MMYLRYICNMDNVSTSCITGETYLRHVCNEDNASTSFINMYNVPKATK